tara:strand:+ start:1446 stop:1547 length:102 start_codon:yes stop_codon:yes gene_type:complete
VSTNQRRRDGLIVMDQPNFLCRPTWEMGLAEEK